MKHFHIQTTQRVNGKSSVSLSSQATAIRMADAQLKLIAQEYREVGHTAKIQKDGSVVISNKKYPNRRNILEIIECECEECENCKNTIWGIRI